VKPAAKLPPPRWRQQPLRKVCGQFHAPEGHTILHLTCGHHLKVSGPRPTEAWALCEACCPPAPVRGHA
jgi:hypothetical protein